MKDYTNKIITVPNILSFIRLCLIPVILWEYIFLKKHVLAAATVIVSGITDIADGFIARKFNMVSHVGRILDPVADKLTQMAVIACLCSKYIMMVVPLAILVVKELANGIIALVMLKRTGNTINSRWHGKLATVILYVMMVMHLFWVDIPAVISDIFIWTSISSMALSFVLYTLQNAEAIKSAGEISEKNEEKQRNESIDY